MAVKQFHHDIDLTNQELRNASFEVVAADPATNLFDGRLVWNTTEKRIKVYDGGSTSWDVIANLDDLEQFSTLVGAHDASGGAVPTAGSGPAGAEIRAGDRWYVTVAGTIAGLSSGSTVLEVGDMLIAINDVATGSQAASDFISIQTNANLTSAGQVEQVVIASIPANTATAIGTSYTTVYSAQFFDSSGIEISLYYDRTNGQVTSNTALTNVTGIYVGI